MKTNTLLSLFLGVLFFTSCSQSSSNNIKVLQFNIWQEGTVVPNGYEAIITEIINSEADIIALSEVRNYNKSSLAKRMVEDLKQKGFTFYMDSSQDSGILSKYPIVKQEMFYPVKDDRGSITKAIINVHHLEIAFYSAHLDYRNCAIYLPRGYDGSTWKELKAPIFDKDSILNDNNRSKRIEAIRLFIADARKEMDKGRVVILAGDFNEASHLDWIEANKHKYEHNGLVIPWTCTKELEDNNFKDVYREQYPNPISHPGFTFPVYNPDVDFSKLVWAPKSDDRDRIDYIFYNPSQNIRCEKTYLIGPRASIAYNKVVSEVTEDSIVSPLGIWPTDHMALFAQFEIN
ncbi:endonuclease/exonuclease/phosphatase family protein [Flammeovirga sp. MY04]|uniref:endonuclease/exonuclease/phosphatase family protein n=1 Tax=Flammeovirga sp. MY04 TaxID=1191459 RepID=UPI0008064170|nr:endonuclease/exonuclease/phosphatase family protein [Flammeovirga sp. MY04]ANQ48088.1 endonuclease/exonuclease/phosphatase family protein [Flammeovirga sp. MY04]